jgi:hypothetical protein
MGQFAAFNNKTNTVSATVPMWNLVGGTARRLKLNDIIIGCDAAPADQAVKHALLRTSARGTQTSTVTPNPLDPADHAASGLFDTAWSADPTITANSTLLQIPQNQRASFRHQVNEGREFIIPAVSGAGIAMLSVVATAAANYAWSVFWAE